MHSSRIVQGTAVSPGLAVGSVHVIHAGPTDVPTWTVAREDVPAEIGRLADALNAAAHALSGHQKAVAAGASEKDAEIFAVHRMILQDPSALADVEKAISEQRINAEAAVKTLIQRFEATMGKLDGDSVRAYASDVSDPWRLVLDFLLARQRDEVVLAKEKVVLAAADLTPGVVTYFEREQILAIVTEAGGRFSHGAVLARSLGIPCVVGLTNLLARLEQGMTLAVDGDHGRVQLRPEKSEIARFLEKKRSFEQRREALILESARPSITPDGTRFGVAVNMESTRDLDTFDVSHTDGVGLLRTEFLYMESSQFPSEEEQYRLYRHVLERFERRPATFRLLDIGGDKPLPYFKTAPETNPALGWRGLRITLEWRDLLRVQLRALLRASPHGNLRILLPMVSSLEEILQVHETFDEVKKSLEHQGYEVARNVPVGSMIEVPSALFAIDGIVAAVDFVSVGTNDLVQYLLAVDRDNSWVAKLYEPQHPAVIAALDCVSRSARALGKPVSVCGDMAGDPAIALLLLGLGYDSVSVAPQFIPAIKYAVRRTTFAEAYAFAGEVKAERFVSGVRERLERFREHLESFETAGT